MRGREEPLEEGPAKGVRSESSPHGGCSLWTGRQAGREALRQGGEVPGLWKGWKVGEGVGGLVGVQRGGRRPPICATETQLALA